MTDNTTTTMDSTTTDGVPGHATALGREQRQVTPPEDRYATELAFLAAHDPGPRPPGWLLTPRAVVTFVMGSAGEALSLPKDARPGAGVP
ncbi:AAA family ATPase, partial [Streptomyces sp. SID8455]|nr:AAA family ATPase [Streptomyces sp. SID8455]